VDQVVKICEALSQIDEFAPYSRQRNSFIMEARKCLEALEQDIEKLEPISLIRNEPQDTYKNNPLPSLSKGFEKLSAVGNLVSKGHILDTREGKINSPMEVVTKHTNRLSLKRRRQVLVISYLIDSKNRSISQDDLNYIKETLENMKNNLDGI